MGPPAAPPAPVNGVLPISVLQKNAPAAAPRGPSAKAAAPRLKLVLRRLPPGLTKAEFEAALGDDWKLGAGKVDWLLYKAGKISKDLAKPSRPSRAYLKVTSQENATALSDLVRHASFNDAANSARDAALIGPPTLEFAPNSRAPGGRRRNDARQGLIDQDPEFKDFLESLTNPVTKPETNGEGASEKPDKVTTTPLIEHIREKKANKDKPQAKLAGKHARGESRDDKSDKAGDKKIISKAGKENAAASSEKGRKMSRAERAAKEAVKVLNKEASAKVAETASPTASAPPERKRERGSGIAAAKILQRDLGIGPAPARRRGTKRESSAAPPDSANKPEETPPVKETQAEASATAPPDKQANAKVPAAPKPPKESNRPTRAERRAHKAAREEKNSQPNAEGSKPQPKTPPAPVILKKPPTAPQSPAKGPAQPPKGPAASRATPPEPAAAKAIPPTAPAATQKAAQVPTPSTTAPTSTGRQAFLKHANPSQGITEPLIEAALAVFGAIEKVEIDKRKGFAYVDFADPNGLQKAIAGSPVKIAQGAVQVLERKEKPARRPPGPAGPPTGPARGGRAGGFAGRGGRGRGGGRGGAVVANEGAQNSSTSVPVTASAVNTPADAPTLALAPAPAPVEAGT
ncbi:uncharacterized protein BDZ99DRAFT_486607 [Mytilinidion resinicola]|uniref:RRM domain-containing protein n=1 Tax=Mytilinidion resinicola TaxID=574789 RepID=A0A6A6YZF4_9PEZI|nr:uncharacterized protein BDZ99DRAFT_486607 [Mytilinidion resinicola]KAF2813337.1 hypothetical protein BDZ99DRAFT_486607 [Mytilinidion resinicola]